MDGACAYAIGCDQRTCFVQAEVFRRDALVRRSARSDSNRAGQRVGKVHRGNRLYRATVLSLDLSMAVDANFASNGRSRTC
jgi:hypothetical protein